MFGINPLDLYVTLRDMMMKMMVLNTNMASSGQRQGALASLTQPLLSSRMVECVIV
jgi:hypothetical protein